jgi:guanylate kinase
MALRKKGIIFVISGPSGSGKTTLAKNLLKALDLKDKLVKSVSFTTRPQRPGEVEGKDYFFINERQFRKEQKAKKILEWTRYLGYYYATSKDFIEKNLKVGSHILLCLDLKGALKIKRIYPGNTVTIFIIPPSLKVLRDRIRKRSHATREKEILLRIRLAKKELLAKHSYDHCIFNNELAAAVKGLKKIVLEKINLQ